MFISAENTSLICPCNDLESQTILDIGQRLGLDVHKIDGGWGITLETALNQIAQPAQLRDHLITIELPDSNGLAPLQQLGKQVHVIDHHQYSAEAKVVSPLPSSLEQFAALLGYDLTEEEYQIAVNDRDFLPGLSKAGVSLEQAQSLRQQELELRGKVETMAAAKAFVTEHKRELDDLRLVLAPEEYAGVMLEAAQWPTDKAYTDAVTARKPVDLKPTLILYHRAEQPKAIYQIEYAGPAKHRQALADLFADWQHEFQLWLGGGQYGCFFGAKRRTELADVDGLVSQLLNISLHTGRPLRHYGCTFYLPLDLFLEDDLAKNSSLPLSVAETKRYYLDTEVHILEKDIDSVKGREKQAYLYFLPHLQKMIFEVKGANNDLGIKPIEHWRLDEKMTLELGSDNPLVVNLTDVSLYRYFNNTYLLAISVQPAIQLDGKSSLHRDGTDWWRDLFFTDDAEFQRIAGLQLHHWLHFTNQARIIYPSFFEQVFEGKITIVTLKTAEESVEFKHQDDLSPIVLFLLKLFFVNADENQLKQRLQYLPDDKMVVSPAYGLVGQPLKSDDSKRLFSLALYVDRKSDTYDALDGYAYDPQFVVEGLLERDSLARWFGLGNYSGYCGYANAYLGFGRFFSNVIAPSHVPYIYGRMLILALFYQMALRHYNRRINYATKELSENETTDQFQELRKEFIRFTNTYWFREVTSQVQGIEVFDLQTKALQLEDEYALIKDEMERADEYSTALRSENLNNRILWFTIIATILGIIAVALSAYEIFSS